MEEFDLNNTVPVAEENGTTVRALPVTEDFDLDKTVPVTGWLNQAMQDIKEAKEDIVPTLKLTAKGAFQMTALQTEEEKTAALRTAQRFFQVVRWPYWRFIEHPTTTIATAAQEPGKEPVPQTIKKTLQAYIPFRQIPKEEYGTYGKLWNNYYKSIMGTDAPDWYIAMASYGSAVGIEVPVIRGLTKAAELAASRPLTEAETVVVRNHPVFQRLQTWLEEGKIDAKTLHPEGNIIRLSDDSEVFLNKYVTAVVRGDSIRVPRWAKIKMPEPATQMVTKETALTAQEILPITSKEVILTPVGKAAQAAEPIEEVLIKSAIENNKKEEIESAEGKAEPDLTQEAKKYKTAEEFVKAQQPINPNEGLLKDIIEKTKLRYPGKKYNNVKSGQYLYHGTDEGSFRQIRENGMKTGQAIGAEGNKYSDLLFFGDTELQANSYALRKAAAYNPRLIRIKVDNPKDFYPDMNVVSPGDFVTAKYISPADIEVKVGKKWEPIQEHINEDFGLMAVKNRVQTKSQLTDIWKKAHKPEVKPVETNPLIAEAKKYKSAEEFTKIDFGAEPAAAIPGEAVSFLGAKEGDFDTAQAQIIYDEKDNQSLGYKIVLRDGQILQNPKSDKIGGSPYFETMEEAQTYAKSQLTDIWNKAHAKQVKPDTLIAEAKKYKTAEEWVESQVKEKYGIKYLDPELYDNRTDFVRDVENLNPYEGGFNREIATKQIDAAFKIWGDKDPSKSVRQIPVDKIDLVEPPLSYEMDTPKDVTEPIDVIYYPEEGRYHLVDGRHRLAQAKYNKSKTIPAKVEGETPKSQLTDIWKKAHAEDTATPKQIKQAHIIANKKGFISEKGKVKPQYRHLAKQMVGKKSIKEMTKQEAETFINALSDLPEPTYKGGKLVPPSMPNTTAITTEGFFERTFKKPTPVKLLTSQSRYAELLGVKELTEPFEIGKQKLDLEYGKISNQIDLVSKKLEIAPEKMSQLLNTSEEAPTDLSEKDKNAFSYFRNLTRGILSRENAVREAVGLEPIPYRKGYFRHIADKMAQEVIDGKYPLPEGLKYWSEQLVGKKVYNPMEMQRKLRDDLLEHFSKDLNYVMKSMVWTGLKEIYLAQPKYYFNRILGALSKDKAAYNTLTPSEKAHYDAQMTMPASTKKWLIDYVNIVLSGRQTALDESVNLWITDTPIKNFLNGILRPFGTHIGQRPFTNLISNISKLPIYGVMGGVRPKQLLRNKLQTLQDMALHGVKNTFKGYFSTMDYPVLNELKSDSLFKQSYSGFEDMAADLKTKIEKIGLASYQWTAISNVSQAMNSAYHWTADLIQNPAKKELGWADSQRTYKEDKNFFYPSEKEKILKEMEYGAHTTQFQYIGMGMPEIFRYKALAGLTRLQSWWMNHWFIFHREAATRAFTGHTGYDTNLRITMNDRVNYLKYLLIAGLILNTLGYERSYLFGTAPTALPPTAQLALGIYTYFTNFGDADWQKRKQAEAGKQIKESLKTFLPGYLSIKDLVALLSGDKDWTDYLFYKKSVGGKVR